MAGEDDTPQAVGRAALEAELVDLAGPGPRLFADRSLMDRVGRESALVLAGARAALLQLAHPFVARAVAEHSQVFTDVQARFRRTLSAVYALIYAPPAEALATARRIHAIHTQVEGALPETLGRHAAGSRYRANHVPALYWVAATLWDSSLLCHDLFFEPLTTAEKDAYLRETVRFGRLFGIPAEAQPTSWADFQAYQARMLRTGELAAGADARAIAARLLAPPRAAAAPFYLWLRAFTAGLLPPPLRAAFGLRYGPADRVVYTASVHTLRYVLPRLPAALRHPPAWHRAQARDGLRPAPGPVVRLVPRVALWLASEGR